MMWNYGGNYPMFSGMMIFMMIGIVAAYIILLLAAWRLVLGISITYSLVLNSYEGRKLAIQQ